MNREQEKMFYLFGEKEKTENLKLISFRIRKKLPKIDLELPNICVENKEVFLIN